MSQNRIPPEPVKHRSSRHARKTIGEKRKKGTIYHYGIITPLMAQAYIKALVSIKPAFRSTDWHKQIEFFAQFL